MGLEIVKFTSKPMVGSLHTIVNQPKNGTALEKEKNPVSSCESVKLAILTNELK